MKRLLVLFTFIAALPALAGIPSQEGYVAQADRIRVPALAPMETAFVLPFPARRLLNVESFLPSPAAKTASADRRAGKLLEQTSLRFTENRGQIADTEGHVRNDILFIADAPGARLYFRRDGVSYVFTNHPLCPGGHLPIVEGEKERGLSGEIETRLSRIDMTLSNANPFARIRMEDELPGYSNYYLAHCPQGIARVKSYAKLVYENVYTNIDLVFKSAGGRMKYEYLVHPGGDVSDIAMRYSGAVDMDITGEGALEIHYPLGHIVEETPYTYQRVDDFVYSAYTLNEDVLSFEVEGYDRAQTLVIDPWSTYYGGSESDEACGIATDYFGNVSIAGFTSSMNFPVSGAYQGTYAGSRDAFVVKLDASGSRLWSTYYGGNENDQGYGVAVDGSGNVIMIGSTPGSNFPVTAGAFQTVYGGGMTDAFVVMFDGGGARLWATYCGGNGDDYGNQLTVDGTGSIICSGTTGSSNFPVTAGAFQTAKGPGTYNDAFVIKFSGSGSRMWATYYGGKGGETGRGITVDANDDIFFTGATNSKDFPVSAGAFQQNLSGGIDSYLVKLSSSGGRLWATYLGGSADDWARCVACDGAGYVILAGYVSSANMPVSQGAIQASLAGGSDFHISKFSSAGALQWATYYGGAQSELLYGAATDANGNVVLGGATASANFPVSAGAFQIANHGTVDVAVVKLDANGNRLWATYMGGSQDEYCRCLALDQSVNVLICGSTYSTDFPIYNAFQSAPAGGQDAFMAQLNPSGLIPGYNSPPVAVASGSPSQGPASLTVNFSPAGSYDPDGTITAYEWNFGDGSPVSALPDPAHLYANPGVYNAVLTVTDNNNATGNANVLITVSDPNSYVYVYNQTVTRVKSGNKWRGRDVVTIYNAQNQAVSGAVVTATYTGPNSGTVNGTTGANGTVTLETSQKQNPSGTWCFTVTNVQASGYTFNSSIGVITACETPKLSASPPGSIDVTVTPNPFSASTMITVENADPGPALLRVFDLSGRAVSTLINGKLNGGIHTVSFSGEELPAGVYIWRLEAQGEVLTGSMMLIR